jgi:hypothetical protein
LLTVTNRGQEPAGEVVIACEFDEPLVFPGSADKRVTQQLGSLGPGESRQVALTLTSRLPGAHCGRFTVTAAGVEAVWKSVCVEYVPRQLQLTVVGPTRRTVGSRAEFNIKLVNVTAQELKGVTATATFDRVLVPREITTGGELSDNRVRWNVGTLQPGEGVQLQIEFETQSPSAQACVQFETAGQTLPEEQLERCLQIFAAKGPLDVQVADTHDPLKVGTETEYVITVRNGGLRPADDVAVTAQMPNLLRITSAEVRLNGQPLKVDFQIDGQELRFRPANSLAANSELQYHIRAKGLQPGDAELRVTVSSQALTEPIEVAEPTTVYE